MSARLLWLILIGAVFACSEDNKVQPSQTGVAIVDPPDQSVFTEGSVISITAAATEELGVLRQMDFYVNGNKVGEDNATPYNYQLTDLSAGEYILSVVAVNEEGLEVNSVSVTVSIIE